MPKQTLNTNLQKLREQLADPGSLDDDTREQLAVVANTIEKILHEPSPDYQEAHASLQTAALSFEARHPAFARILSEVTDAVAKLGI